MFQASRQKNLFQQNLDRSHSLFKQFCQHEINQEYANEGKLALVERN